jgi:hypothetical protein
VRSQRQEVRRLADRRHLDASEHLNRHEAAVLAQVQRHALGKARQVRDDEDALLLKAPHEGKHLAVVRLQELEAAAPEGRSAIRRFVHQSSECGFWFCASTLTVS